MNCLCMFPTRSTGGKCYKCDLPIMGESTAEFFSPLKIQVGGDHYRKLAIQPVEFCQRNQLGYCESAVIKYVTRHREKNGVEDIDKAIHYLQLLKEIEYPPTTEKP